LPVRLSVMVSVSVDIGGSFLFTFKPVPPTPVWLTQSV